MDKHPKVDLILPVYNEDSILEENLTQLFDYLNIHSHPFDWEVVLIDDGSTDRTAEIAQHFSDRYGNFKVYRHDKNRGLGEALQLGFSHSTGDYVIVMDADLSYSLEHIHKLYEKIKESHAKVVIASPYMERGKLENVPFFRRFLSKYANRFLSHASNTHLTTLTGMVRAYDGEFIRSLSLRSSGSEIMPEIIYKSMVLDAKIEEIPAQLKWIGKDTKKRSKMKVFSHTLATLLTGFLLRPFLFFILPGLLILLFALYTNGWMFMHYFEEYFKLGDLSGVMRLTTAFRSAYYLHTHTFVVGLLSLMLAVQLIAIGLHSLQTKHYFEELFVLGTKLLRNRDKKR